MSLSVSEVLTLMNQGFALIEDDKGRVRLNRPEPKKWYAVQGNVFDWMKDRQIVEPTGVTNKYGVYYRLKPNGLVTPERFRAAVYVILGTFVPGVQIHELELNYERPLDKALLSFRGGTVGVVWQPLRDNPSMMNEYAKQAADGLLKNIGVSI